MKYTTLEERLNNSKENTTRIIKEDVNNQNFLQKINSLTDANNHQEARLEIAKHFKLKQYEKIFSAIIAICDVERYTPSNIFDYSNEKTEEMLMDIERKHGEEIVSKINSNL